MLRLLGAGLDLLTTWLTGKQKVVESAQQAQAAAAEKRAAFRLERERNSNKWLRLYSYLMFSTPIVVTVIAPHQGAEIFKNLEHVPDWYINAFFAMNGAVWALAEVKNLAQRNKN